MDIIKKLKTQCGNLNTIKQNIHAIKELNNRESNSFTFRMSVLGMMAGTLGVIASIFSVNDLNTTSSIFTVILLFLSSFGILQQYDKDKQIKEKITLLNNTSKNIKLEISCSIEDLEVQKQILSLLYSHSKKFNDDEMTNFQLAIIKKDYLLATEYLKLFIGKIITHEENQPEFIKDNLLINELHHILGLKNINYYNDKDDLKEKVMNAL